jgi:hypothetical protein
VGGGVFLRMPVVVGERDDAVEGRKNVPRDIGIGVLVDRDRRGGVRDKNMADPLRDPALQDQRRYAARDVNHIEPG